MRQRPSGKDKDVPVFEFAMGKVELELLWGVLNNTYKNLPSGMEFQQHKARIRNMMNCIKRTLDEYLEL